MKQNKICLMVIDLDHSLILGQCPGWVELIPGMIAHIGQMVGVIRECIQVEPDSAVHKMFRLLYGKPEDVTRVSLPNRVRR